MTDKIIDQWVVECRTDPLKDQVFDGKHGKQAAQEYQESLARHGFASQLYHSRHILIKEPVRWLAAGQGFIVERKEDPTHGYS